ncbi:MAG TPA: ATP-dependent helicase [Gammaproteobacteria bacterium]|nr:ATP-dependent helicase [Gammaproteobacteria bacterium]
MNITLADLNGNQRQAVEWKDGRLLVLAGPGSGKTTVLTLRIAKLVENSQDENFRILGLTFTVKAAREMQARIDGLLNEKTRRVKLCTFHSFCTELLRQHGSHLGLHPDFSVITDDKDRASILKEMNDTGEIEIANPEDALKKIDVMFTHGIDVDELSNYFKPEQQEQCAALQSIFKGYLNELTESNQLDFGSMLYFSRKLLETMPRILRQVKTVYRYICVDEFQDTNLAQYRLLKLIAEPESANLFVVADDDQVIFQWNGADPKRLEELKSEYHPHIIQLPENFRCPHAVVEIANKLIAHNSDRDVTKIAGVAHSRVQGTVSVDAYDSFDAEIQGLIEKINPIPKNQRETCLVIARSNKLLSQVKVAFDAQGINADIVSKHQDFSCPLVLTIYYCLKLANSPDSRSVLNKLCSVVTQINGITLSAEDVFAKSSVEEITTLRAFFVLASESNILRQFCDDSQRTLCDSMNYLSFIEQSFDFFNALNIQDEGEDLYPDYSDDKNNWHRISSDILREHGSSVNLHVFLQEMDLTPKSKPLAKDCVRLQTVHTAKGMEFDNVFIVGLAEDQFPTYFAIKNGGRAIEEERRNCFVAITRSSRNLYLSYARNYFGWAKQPSRFLKEMGLVGG